MQMKRFCYFEHFPIRPVVLCFILLVSYTLVFTPLMDFLPLPSLTKTNKTNKYDDLMDFSPIPSLKKTNQANKYDDFRREWVRQRRARMDWQAIINPCHDNMAWGKVKAGWEKPNRTNASTSEIIFQDIRPAGEYSKIFIQSKTSDNITKVIGGDFWRVYVRGPANIAATLFDHNNGTYEALFLIMEPGIYQLLIYLDYSLCDGFKDPPRDWFIQGNVQGKGQREGLLGPLDDYLFQPLQSGRPLEINVTKAETNFSLDDKLHSLESCSSTCNNLWDGFGRWKNDKWRPYLEESYNWSLPANYSSSGTLWVYGDSLAVRLHLSVSSRALCRKLYLKCKHSYNWLYPIINEQQSKTENDNLDFRAGEVLKAIRNVLNTNELQQPSSVLLLNLGLHYTTNINFTTFQKLIGEVINLLKETQVNLQGKEVPKYKAKIIWKSTTALCKHNGAILNPTNNRFLTPQRVLLFSAYAMSAMCQTGFDVIDVYPMTDSYPGGTVANDVVHYPNKVFNTLETLLENYKANRNQRIGTDDSKRRIGRCTS